MWIDVRFSVKLLSSLDPQLLLKSIPKSMSALQLSSFFAQNVFGFFFRYHTDRKKNDQRLCQNITYLARRRSWYWLFSSVLTYIININPQRIKCELFEFCSNSSNLLTWKNIKVIKLRNMFYCRHFSTLLSRQNYCGVILHRWNQRQQIPFRFNLSLVIRWQDWSFIA